MPSTNLDRRSLDLGRLVIDQLAPRFERREPESLFGNLCDPPGVTAPFEVLRKFISDQVAEWAIDFASRVPHACGFRLDFVAIYTFSNASD
jgi:hypothetical protein